MTPPERLAHVQASVAGILAAVADRSVTTTAGVEPVEPDTMTDSQADREYALDADAAAAALLA